MILIWEIAAMEYTPRITDNALAARAAAAGSMVLLKNVRNTLPFAKNGDEPLPIAVFGVGQVFTACCTAQMQPWHKICVLDGLAASEVVKPDGLLVHKHRNCKLLVMVRTALINKLIGKLLMLALYKLLKDSLAIIKELLILNISHDEPKHKLLCISKTTI